MRYQKLNLTKEVLKELEEGFLAFDTETTGFSPISERIIELGAVKYSHFQKGDIFSSLVNPRKIISPEISAINHINNQMLQASPKEEEIYPRFVEYMKEALEGKLILVGHNAIFDMKFLNATLTRLGYSGDIRYIDTLSISKALLPKLDDHKQCTLANYYGIINPNAHRAYEDADTCAQILIKMIQNI